METMYFIKFTENNKFLSSLHKTSYSTVSNIDDGMKFETFQIAKAFIDYIDSIYGNQPQMGIFKIEAAIPEAAECEEVR